MNKGNTVRLGVIGCGSFSSVIAYAVKRSKKAELVTCFDIIPEIQNQFSERFGCDREKSYEAVLKRDDIDGVLLVSPNAVHAVLAAQHGKHVYVEKPISNTIADGKEMIRACQEAGVVLMVGHHLRRNAGNRKLKELIEEGIIGNPIMVEANVSNYLGFELTPDKFRWYGDNSGCPAGALMSMGIHYVDVFNYFFGRIKTVFSYFNKLYIPADVEDVTATIFQFESKILGYLGANYASPKAHWMYVYGTKANVLFTVSAPDLPFDEYLKAISNPSRFTQLVLFEKGREPRDIPLAQVDPFLEEIDEFAHCVRTGDRPETDGQGALVALAFIRAAIDSARTGNQVRLEIW